MGCAFHQCTKCRRFIKQSDCVLHDDPMAPFGPELICPHCKGLVTLGCPPIAFLILPACLAIAADQTDYLPFKMGVPLVCAALLLTSFRRKLKQRAGIWFVIAAFVFSAVGDYFLSNKSGNESYFVIGIAAFFVAHLGYLGFCLVHGRLHRIALAVLFAGYLPYFLFFLRPAIDEPILLAAVLLYLLISCVVLAAALGLKLSPAAKWLYVFGILMIVVSDTFISFNEFLKYRAFNNWILPTYYLAHLTVTASIFLAKKSGGGSRFQLSTAKFFATFDRRGSR